MQDTSVERVSARLVLADDYADARGPGEVIGSVGAQGIIRRGVDTEGIIAIDNGALRFQPLAQPGWGREGIAYGPFARRPGLALGVLALNGHNASQTYYLPETRKERLRRLLTALRRGQLRRPLHRENFSVGWFTSESGGDPFVGANSFVMHSATADNGELWATVDGGPMPVVRGVQNIPILYVVVVRERGAAYYAASLPDGDGLGSFPSMRPLAIDTRGTASDLYAGAHQRILGEVGYRVDSRIEGVRVGEVPAWTAWYGTAHVADRFVGRGALDGSVAETGGVWQAEPGFRRTGRGVTCEAGAGADRRAVVPADEPSGLLHADVRADARDAVGLVFRADGAGRGWSFVAGAQGCELAVRDEGPWHTVERTSRWRLRPGRTHALQVTDDGTRIGLYLDGRLVFDRWIDDERHASLTGVGVRTIGPSPRVERFEVHPRAVPVPDVLAMAPPTLPPAATSAFSEGFTGPAEELRGTATNGGGVWELSEGAGSIERTGSGNARVRADRDHPNPGRTIYTLPWDEPGYAELTVELTQPGSRRGEGEAGRGGLVFWQDPDNYLVVNLWVDDTFEGASISTFYHLGGHEVMWDAVWTLVRGVDFGTRNTLEVRFDGARFLASLDGRPSLYRALTDVYPETPPLRIERVGLIVNWEWGDDTGTVFHRFSGRS